ncbi:MAG: hypothetical protein WC595_03185 [Candidatus Nanoarchaeia archaeon]
MITAKPLAPQRPYPFNEDILSEAAFQLLQPASPYHSAAILNTDWPTNLRISSYLQHLLEGYAAHGITLKTRSIEGNIPEQPLSVLHADVSNDKLYGLLLPILNESPRMCVVFSDPRNHLEDYLKTHPSSRASIYSIDLSAFTLPDTKSPTPL